MRCSEALVSVRLPVLLTGLVFVLAVSQAFTADPPAATEHETRKPQATNRLATETSPYLLLHARNPVDWRPWGPEALQAAKDANKPIFLSIGYSSCYWCHVMEREVFENDAIAAYLNQHFICIKVDREERPDIDDQYMLALQLYYQAIGSPQGGGWPMSMFLTPDAKPFAGGTYFPAEDKEGMPGFRTVAEQIQTLWTTREADLRNNADFLAAAVKRHSQPGLSLEKVELHEMLVEGAVAALLQQHDPEHGGFYNPEAPEGPKFPSAPNLLLFELRMLVNGTEVDGSEGAERSKDIQQALELTLNRMATGGLRDHLAGGFHRYSVDRDWRVPHFEKMLYDQAQLAEVYWLQFSRTQNPRDRQVAEETLDFVLRDMTSPEGAFYSALDAETDGVEGQYYVWSRAEVESALGPDDARVFAVVYGLEEESKFEHGHVLYLPQSIEAAAQQVGIPVAEFEPRLAGMREKLLAVRQERPALLRDDKILTSWNGLMIRALATAGLHEENRKYVEAAERAAKFVLDNLRDEEGRLLHSYAGGKAGIPAHLDDYAYFISGLLALGTAADDGSEWFALARSLMDQQFVLFWDQRGDGFFYTADNHEPLLTRVKDANDSVLPSANAVSAQNLFVIADFETARSYREPLEQTLRLFAPALKGTPASHPTLAATLDAYLRQAGEVAGQPQAPPVPADSAAVSVELAFAPAEELIPAAEPTAEDAKKHDKLSAVAYLSHDKIPAGGECYVAVVIDVKKEWHINANPAQPKYLIPTELTATLPAEITLTDVRYPAGASFKQKGLDEPMKVYEGRVILYGKIKAPASAAGQNVGAELTLRYQSCNDKMCLPPKKLMLTGSLSVAAQGEQPKAINQSLFKRREK